jgi:hypothetical protein
MKVVAHPEAHPAFEDYEDFIVTAQWAVRTIQATGGEQAAYIVI